MSNKWTEDLKKGDEVIVNSRSGKSIQTVERLTKTLVVVKDYGKFNKESRCSVPYDYWANAFLKQATEKEVTKIKKAESILNQEL